MEWTDHEPRVRAFAVWYATEEGDGRTPSEIADELEERGEYLKIDGREYRVLDDDERGDETRGAFRDAVDSLIDDCGTLDGLDENLRGYFDRERYARDTLLSDGHGPTLASYDGDEDEIEHDGAWWYIYRQL